MFKICVRREQLWSQIYNPKYPCDINLTFYSVNEANLNKGTKQKKVQLEITLKKQTIKSFWSQRK